MAILAATMEVARRVDLVDRSRWLCCSGSPPRALGCCFFDGRRVSSLLQTLTLQCLLVASTWSRLATKTCQSRLFVKGTSIWADVPLLVDPLVENLVATTVQEVMPWASLEGVAV